MTRTRRAVFRRGPISATRQPPPWRRPPQQRVTRSRGIAHPIPRERRASTESMNFLLMHEMARTDVVFVNLRGARFNEAQGKQVLQGFPR